MFSPAKVNLFLAITGRRADGFHDLVSLVAPLAFGDELTMEPMPEGDFRLECSDPAVPTDGSNLVLKAARLFAERSGWRGGARFRLEKRIPMGAGLGGGSSNGVTALLLVNQAAGSPLSAEQLGSLAAQLGSDCPLFLQRRPIVMRGRGERVETMPEETAQRLRGRRVLLFKPEFGISTAWAYQRLAHLAASDPAAYRSAEQAEARLSEWLRDAAAQPEKLLYNTLERPAFSKHLALPTLLAELRRRHDLEPRMTGSGSACFAFLGEQVASAPIVALIKRCWGDSSWVVETRLA